MRTHRVFLATILLDAHRWHPPRVPAARVSDWLDRIAAAGFDGLELWEFHWRHADAAERARLLNSSVPVRVYNSYVEPASALADSAELLAAVSDFAYVQAIKFNLGAPTTSLAEEIEGAEKFARL